MLGRYDLVSKLKRLRREIDTILLEQEFPRPLNQREIIEKAIDGFVAGFKRALHHVGETAKDLYEATVYYGDKAITKAGEMWTDYKVSEKTVSAAKSVKSYVSDAFGRLKKFVSETYDAALIKVGLREPPAPPPEPTLFERFKAQIMKFYDVVKNFMTTNPYLAGAIIIFLFLFVLALTISKRELFDFSGIWEAFKQSISNVWSSMRSSWETPGLTGKIVAVVKGLFSPISILVEFLTSYEDSAQITSLGALCITFVLLGYAYYRGVGPVSGSARLMSTAHYL